MYIYIHTRHQYNQRLFLVCIVRCPISRDCYQLEESPMSLGGETHPGQTHQTFIKGNMTEHLEAQVVDLPGHYNSGDETLCTTYQ